MTASTPTPLPASLGHWFDPELLCTECGQSWDQQRVTPTECTNPKPDSKENRYRPDPVSGFLVDTQSPTKCKRGHPYGERGARGENGKLLKCVECERIKRAERLEANRDEINAKRRAWDAKRRGRV